MLHLSRHSTKLDWVKLNNQDFHREWKSFLLDMFDRSSCQLQTPKPTRTYQAECSDWHWRFLQRWPQWCGTDYLGQFTSRLLSDMQDWWDMFRMWVQAMASSKLWHWYSVTRQHQSISQAIDLFVSCLIKSKCSQSIHIVLCHDELWSSYFIWSIWMWICMSNIQQEKCVDRIWPDEIWEANLSGWQQFCWGGSTLLQIRLGRRHWRWHLERQVSFDSESSNRMHQLLCSVLFIALLAISSAERRTITLNTVVRDFKAYPQTGYHLDFESTCGDESNIEETWRILTLTGGIVGATLDADGKPYLKGSSSLTIHSAAGFSQWYRDTPGVNIASYKTLTLTETGEATGIFQIVNNNYFPVDGEGWPPGYYQSSGHNFHFTTEIAT